MKENKVKTMQEKLFDRNFKKFGLDLNPVVSIAAGLFLLFFSAFALLNLEKTQILFEIIKTTILSKGDWLFILASNYIIIVCLILAFSKLGEVRIGGINAKPEFSNFAWYSMLLSAGVGIGLMFYGVGEPLFHNDTIPPIFKSPNSGDSALATTFFHWGVHGWAIFGMVGLALAFFAYNKGLPLTMRSVFYPILKDKVFGIIGDCIDILAVIACLFGLATSLGLGAQQINSGLNYILGIPYNSTIQVILIIFITGIATLSVVAGLDKGVKVLSELNVKIAFAFIACIFLIGPTSYIIKTFLNSFGVYIDGLVKASFFVSYKDISWQGSWSIFYLAWWFSWSPFVGMFIARISKGRTIKEFILAVMIVPSLLTFVWFSILGGTALFVNNGANGKLFEIVQTNLPVALFEMIHYLKTPVFTGVIQVLLSILATFLIISFFVTSSDSGSLVVDNITSGGKLDSPVPQRIFWACMEGLIAAVLLLIGGEKLLSTLQTAIISTGLPLAIIVILMTMVLMAGVKEEYKKQKMIKNVRSHKKVVSIISDEEDYIESA